MQLEHSFTVPVGVDDAWRVLLDIERIAPCMPGAAIDSVDGDNFTGTVKVKLGPIGLTYKGKASFVEKDEAAHRAVIDARGRDARGNGTANAKVTATLVGVADSTEVTVVTDLDITGKPAQFGRGVMADVGNKLIGQFADCLAGKLTAGDGPAAAASAPAAAPASDTTAGDAGATPKPRPRPAPSASEDESSAYAPDPEAAADASAASEPAATPVTSAPTAASPEPPATPAATPSARVAPPPGKHASSDVEPINLIESAGPAVAKRLVPALAGLLLLLIVVRRLRR